MDCERCKLHFRDELLLHAYSIALSAAIHGKKLTWTALAALLNGCHWKPGLYGDKRQIGASSAKRLLQHAIKFVGAPLEDAAEVLKKRIGKPLKELTLKESRALATEFMYKSVELNAEEKIVEVFSNVIYTRLHEAYSVVEKIKRSIAKDVREKNT